MAPTRIGFVICSTPSTEPISIATSDGVTQALAVPSGSIKTAGNMSTRSLNRTGRRRSNRALDSTTKRIDGFESPLGMELLATVDWLMEREHAEPTISGIRSGLRKWPAGKASPERNLRLFDDRLLKIALDRLALKVGSGTSASSVNRPS
jgi:hypothetical protein